MQSSTRTTFPARAAAFREIGVWSFGGCNLASASSALSLCGLPLGLSFTIPRRKGAWRDLGDFLGTCTPQREATGTPVSASPHPWIVAFSTLL